MGSAGLRDIVEAKIVSIRCARSRLSAYASMSRLEELHVHGKGLWGLTEPSGPIDCGNSGTGIRLLTGLLAGQDFFTVLTGDESIRRRPMGRIVKPLREMGATIAGRKGGELAPLAVTGSRLRAIAYASPVASAQIKSALLARGFVRRRDDPHHRAPALAGPYGTVVPVFRYRAATGRDHACWSKDGPRSGGMLCLN